jgi:hypothetical protein
MPKAIWVTIESYDTDAAAEAGRKRSVDTTSVGPTRTETVNGLAVTWWQKQRALAQVGRHVVNVSALRAEAEPLVAKVLQSLVPGLKTAKGL